MNKIYCFISDLYDDGVAVVSVSDTCKIMSNHFSSGISWAKHDIGITSDWKHDIYQKEFPNGYELEWVDDVDSHVDLMKIIKTMSNE